MGIATYQLDAFTEKPFQGNPAAVCILLKPSDAKEPRDEIADAWKKHFSN